MRGLQISNNSKLARHVDFVKLVSKKLRKISLIEEAVDTLLNARLYEESIEMALDVKNTNHLHIFFQAY